jgi:hypothetical protein
MSVLKTPFVYTYLGLLPMLICTEFFVGLTITYPYVFLSHKQVTIATQASNEVSEVWIG